MRARLVKKPHTGEFGVEVYHNERWKLLGMWYSEFVLGAHLGSYHWHKTEEKALESLTRYKDRLKETEEKNKVEIIKEIE